MTATPVALHLPYLHYPFPPRVHPETDQVENEMLDWLIGHGLLAEPEREAAFRHTRFAELVGREYPDADSDGLRAVTNLYAWIFVVDDSICDTGTLGQDTARLAAFYAWMREIMEVGSLTAAESLALTVTVDLDEADKAMCHGLAEAMHDVCQSIAHRSSHTQYMRFVTEMDYYFLGTLWESGHHVHSTTPSPAEYAIGRRMTCATPAALALEDIAAGYEVPPEEYQHPAVRKLRSHVSNLNSWADDVFSYGKERDTEGPRPLNLPTSLAQHDGLDVQAAITETARLHRRDMEAYLATRAQLATWASPELNRFLSASDDMLRGFYDWGLNAPRYRLDHYFGTSPQTP
ncbi:hypothetical protein ACFXAZ_27455 [Streptomyces sp. NPDC059477]|uniref:terpene synthase family protein n=1 Tax=Streptomyces sp. NPDC059477 TaxID=3346847 RepID=UPI0036AB1E05